MTTKQNHPKNQHYVPQFILRNFSAGKKKRVFVFDKLKEKTFLSSTRNIAAESGFYDFERDGKKISLEPFMSRMEATASEVIKRIVKQQSLAYLSKSDRIVLSLFAAIQQQRVKNIRYQIKKINEGLRRKFTEYARDFDETFAKMNEDDAKWASIKNIEMAKEFSKYFYEKTLVLQRAPKGTPLYISDNPITLHNHIEIPGRGNLGLNSPGIEIYLPISKQFSICFLCHTMKQFVDRELQRADEIRQLLGYFPIDISSLQRTAQAISTGAPFSLLPENVTHQNSLQVLYSSRFVYSTNDDFELVKSMISENSQIKYPPEIVSQ